MVLKQEPESGPTGALGETQTSAFTPRLSDSASLRWGPRICFSLSSQVTLILPVQDRTQELLRYLVPASHETYSRLKLGSHACFLASLRAHIK